MNMNMVTMAMGRFLTRSYPRNPSDQQNKLESVFKKCAKKVICKSASFSGENKAIIPKMIR